MRAGLAGFAGSGKSTLFELLTGATPDAGKVHSGQVGIATLTDPRIDFLAAMHNPKKVTPATLELLDTPGLLPGTHGANPQRLALIREGDALLIVLGAFSGGAPAADLNAFRDEMLFADLTVVTNRAERLESSAKKPGPDREALQKELETVKRVQAALESNQSIASLGLTVEELKPLRSFGLLTSKPQIVLVNLAQGSAIPQALLEIAPDALAIDAKLELELAQMEPDERSAF
ncbi:MAG TPA: GTPase, partial [Isosphaeraceae bacterium]|nr:GTPase [Isosphaeraceae bacterium]